MSDTPRTDSNECTAIAGLGQCVGVNFARTLERELNQAREELAKLRADRDRAYRIAREATCAT